MASALRFAARKMCGRAFQRPAQPYFTTAVKEEQRRLFPSTTSHGGSSVRRLYSSKSPNLVNNSNKHGPNSAAGAAETERISPPPLWSTRNILRVWGYTMGLMGACYATIFVENRRMGGPFVWKEPPPFVWKEQPDNSGTEPYASEKAE